MMIEPNTELTPVMRQHVMAMIDKRVTENLVTHKDFSELKAVMAELAHAQERTETRVEELACQMAAGFKQLGDQIAELGGRWGIHNEGAFRATIHAVLTKIDGIEMREGDHGDCQVDIIIRNGEHILLEITSRTYAKDIERIFYRVPTTTTRVKASSRSSWSPPATSPPSSCSAS
ncbi:hypothetical protein Thiowin_04407 [Thiorhodovibrio winogradskyi]|uniref:DUF3782 domain-containing protein n=1 Tax=Thiorhodovibrio winogradskyi TaxID=77007 RepID=A0ABZ0SFX1_9GAMM|nr:DUF3782 domain-containing protein [Thiorhodovibrio winogradskyi]